MLLAKYVTEWDDFENRRSVWCFAKYELTGILYVFHNGYKTNLFLYVNKICFKRIIKRECMLRGKKEKVEIAC